MKGALHELKRREVWSVGLIESIVLGVLKLFVFCWTPVLQNTSNQDDIHVGCIFVCFQIALLCGTYIYGIVVIKLGVQYYLSIAISFVIEIALFLSVYFIKPYFLQLLFLTLVNVTSHVLTLSRSMGFLCPPTLQLNQLFYQKSTELL